MSSLAMHHVSAGPLFAYLQDHHRLIVVLSRTGGEVTGCEDGLNVSDQIGDMERSGCSLGKDTG